jgi:cell division protein FtsN
MMRRFTNRAVRSCSYGALGISALALLSGCGWFDSTPVHLDKLRPGAERAMSPTTALPPPAAGQNYDAGGALIDESRGGPAIGSIVAASGGQKAQLDKAEKEQAERDKQDRLAREKASQNLKTADKNANQKTGQSTVNANTNVNGNVTGDKPGEPPTQPVAPARAPVTSAPVPPPTTDAAPSPNSPVPNPSPVAPPDPTAVPKPSGG